MNPNRKCRAVLAVFRAMLALASAASAEWKEKVRYSFQGGADAGSVPASGVVFDKQGHLYGVTSDGGGVYQLAPPAKQGDPWTGTVLYTFQGNTKGDGATPSSGLVIDGSGNLYGVTAYGGTGDLRAAREPSGLRHGVRTAAAKQEGGAWKETILYSFPTAKQGYVPNGDLVFDSVGNLYGATTFGGGKATTCDEFYGGNCGAIFELSPPKEKGAKWAEKVLHAFGGIDSGKQYGDGANPSGGLVLDSKGAVCGTTHIGGYNCPHNSNQGCGAVFELKPPTKRGESWTGKLIHEFKASNDVEEPNGNLIFDNAGALYGTAGGGPSGEAGIIFRLMKNKADAWEKAVLYGFNSNDKYGTDPLAGLIFDPRESVWHNILCRFGVRYCVSARPFWAIGGRMVPEALVRLQGLSGRSAARSGFSFRQSRQALQHNPEGRYWCSVSIRMRCSA
jgi:hypothetical protein